MKEMEKRAFTQTKQKTEKEMFNKQMEEINAHAKQREDQRKQW